MKKKEKIQSSEKKIKRSCLRYYYLFQVIVHEESWSIIYRGDKLH